METPVWTEAVLGVAMLVDGLGRRAVDTMVAREIAALRSWGVSMLNGLRKRYLMKMDFRGRAEEHSV